MFSFGRRDQGLQSTYIRAMNRFSALHDTLLSSEHEDGFQPSFSSHRVPRSACNCFGAMGYGEVTGGILFLVRDYHYTTYIVYLGSLE